MKIFKRIISAVLAVVMIGSAAYAEGTSGDISKTYDAFEKAVIEKNEFTVGAKSTVQNTVTPITNGVLIVSYDINYTPDLASGVRLMQVYDSTLSASNRALLIQATSSGVIAVNEKNTGYMWNGSVENNITVIYEDDKKQSTVFYNNIKLGVYKMYKENAVDFARIDTQNDMGNNTVTVSNVWVRRMSDFDLALKYYDAIVNSSDEEVLEYYNTDKETVLNKINEYGLELDNAKNKEEEAFITEKIWGLVPYTKIFSDDFSDDNAFEGYTVAKNISIVNDVLELNNSGERARLLKSVAGYEGFICEFDFKQDVISDVDTIVRITDSKGEKVAVRLYSQNGAIKINYGSASGFKSKVLIDNYTNKWYKIRLYPDMELKKAYVYIDGAFLGAYDFMYTDIENMNRIFDSYTDSEGTYYIDNIKIFKDEKFVPDISKRIPVTVKNTSGYEAKNQLIRRGFALERGHIYNAEALELVDENGRFIPSVVSDMEQYDDGSIKWALLSFVSSFGIDEKKEFYIVNSNAKREYSLISFSDNELKNERISVMINESGIGTVSFNEEPLLEGMYLYYNAKKLPFSGYDILQENELYIKIRLNAPSDGVMRGEMYVTLWQGAEDIDIEYRFTSLKDITVTDMGCVIECSEGTSINGGGDFVNISSDTSNINLVSYDVERFSGAVSENTGFFMGDGIIYFEPIINDTEFLWYDGLTRTNHFSVTANNAEAVLALKKTPLSVIISPKQFQNSKIIDSTAKNAISDRIEESMEYAYDKRNGCFEAGYIPWIIDKNRKKIEAPTVQHGETDYNLALLQLAQGNSMLFDMIRESSETRSDVSMYKGSVSQAYGAMRYRTGSHMQSGSSKFKTSHPYYGEASGLYMAYLLSGNEYIKESFLNAVEHIYSNIEQGTSELGKYPSMVSWSSGAAKKSNYGESRYIIQIRPLMLASGLTGDSKYKEAAYNIAQWAKNAQTDGGYWYQAYYDDKTPLTQNGQTQPAVKNYIMLYGARGLSYLLKNEENETALEVLKDFSDFLCEEIESYGAGLWSPTGNAELYEVNEDGTRGKMAMQDIMAAEILWRVYEKTADEKYLDACLKCLNSWVCALGPGGLPASVSYLQGYYDGSVSSAQASQNLTVFSFMGELEKFFGDNKELVYKKGFGGLCEVFLENSKAEVPSNPSGHSYPELTSSMYNSNAIFVMNVNGKTSGNYYKEYTTSALGKNLWSGMKNIVDKKGFVSLNACMNQFDTAFAVKCPIALKNNTVKTEVYVDEYNSEQIKVRLKTSEELELEIADGVFDTQSGYYTYKVEKTDDGFIVTVTDSSEGIPKQGTITLDVKECALKVNKIGLYDKDKQKTYNISDAVYISDIGLNAEAGSVDLFVAQYDSGGKLVSLCKKADMTKLTGCICKIMVWKDMQVVAQSVTLKGWEENDL